MRILSIILDRPIPPTTGQRVRNAHIWSELQRLGVEVRVCCIDLALEPGPPQGPPGVETEFFRFDRDPLPRRAWTMLFHSHHEHFRSRALADRVDAIARDWKPDVIHAEELRNTFYWPKFRGKSSAAIQTVTLHNVESELQRRIGSAPFKLGAPIFNHLHRRSLLAFERRALEMADLAFAWSEYDLKVYRGLYPSVNWGVTRNGAAARQVVPAPQVAEPTVLLLGNLGYWPNIQGLFWFLDEIRPRLDPGVRLTVAGSKATPEVRAQLASEPAVRFIDTPLELAPLFAEAALTAVPLFEGSGTRGRLLETLAHERVVVTTTKGAEGIDLGDEEGILIADDAESFARRLAEALRDLPARAEAGRRGREAVLATFDWSVVAAEMKADWEACLARTRAADPSAV
ncbi:MAG TPA: glycosyltransferase family 4 protein [Isosphaeraceae bacterium]|jgi:glycosyltransferase involved in cell wall biosynthesis|nr:glycosyltransferase family 4 protein [Isosphaeraceae bacterium]